MMLQRGLMEIPACSRQFSEQYAVIHQPPCYEVHHLALAFEHAVHGQQPGAQQFAPLRLADVARIYCDTCGHDYPRRCLR